MNKLLKYFLCSASLLFALELSGQIDVQEELYIFENKNFLQTKKTLDLDFGAYIYGINSNINPALKQKQLTQKIRTSMYDSIVASQNAHHIVLGYNKNKLEGLYPVYEGNNHNKKYIAKVGVYPLSATSVFIAKGKFALGGSDGMEWNTARHYQHYYPYILALRKSYTQDEPRGGRFRYQEYMIGATYSKQLGNIYCGVDLLYQGEYANKQKPEPRARNINSILDVKLGIAYTGKKLSANGYLSVVHNWQNIDLVLWRGTHHFTFSPMGSLGFYDQTQELHFFAKSRMQYLGRLGAFASTEYKINKKHSLGINFNYWLDNMFSEEKDNFLDLTRFKKSSLNPHIFHIGEFGSYKTQTDIWAAINMKTGTEHKYKEGWLSYGNSSVLNKFYLGSIQPYRAEEYYMQLRNKTSYPISLNSKISLIAGAGFKHLTEKDIKIHANTSIKQQWIEAGLGYDLLLKKNMLKSFFIYQNNIKKESLYNINNEIKNYFIEQIYSLFLYESTPRQTMMFKLDYSRQLKKNTKIGCAVEICLSLKKDKDEKLEKLYPSMISQKNRDKYINVNLYINL